MVNNLFLSQCILSGKVSVSKHWVNFSLCQNLVHQRTDYGSALHPIPAAGSAEFSSGCGITLAGRDSWEIPNFLLRAASAVRAGLEAAQDLAQVSGRPPRMEPAWPYPAACFVASLFSLGKSLFSCSHPRMETLLIPGSQKHLLSRRALWSSIMTCSRCCSCQTTYIRPEGTLVGVRRSKAAGARCM